MFGIDRLFLSKNDKKKKGYFKIVAIDWMFFFSPQNSHIETESLIWWYLEVESLGGG